MLEGWRKPLTDRSVSADGEYIGWYVAAVHMEASRQIAQR
jgi:hypothetical protein